MTRIPLFCIAEKARGVIYQLLDAVRPEPPRRGIFSYISSREAPSKDAGNNTELSRDQDVHSGFVGASEEECQQWIDEHQARCLMLVPTMLAIADKRTARDGTISLQYYSGEDGQYNFPPFGLLPRKSKTWYSYRIYVNGTEDVYASLMFTEPDVSFPTYFGRKEELTDAEGVFDTVKAGRFIGGLDK